MSFGSAPHFGCYGLHLYERDTYHGTGTIDRYVTTVGDSNAPHSDAHATDRNTIASDGDSRSTNRNTAASDGDPDSANRGAGADSDVGPSSL